MRKLSHIAELVGLYLLFAVFRSLPLDVASFIGGFMGRSVGPFLGAHNIARENLARAFPAMPREEKRRLLTAMWDNLGRVAAELPHLDNPKLYQRMEISGLEHIPPNGKQGIYFSGHIGNWELSYPVLHQHGAVLTVIYRQANNPYTDAVINKLRLTQSTSVIPKGAKGVFKILRVLKNGHSLAMLVDQKMNEGIAVPFFGHAAMTAPAIAELALRYGLPLIPARVLRTKGVHFKGTMYPPLIYENTGDTGKDVLAIMTQINSMLESWIREEPSQWFWVHRRWPKP